MDKPDVNSIEGLSPAISIDQKTTSHNLRYLSKPPLSDEVAAQLTEVYRSDILELQGLLGRDLSHWLAPPKSQNAG